MVWEILEGITSIAGEILENEDGTLEAYSPSGEHHFVELQADDYIDLATGEVLAKKNPYQ